MSNRSRKYVKETMNCAKKYSYRLLYMELSSLNGFSASKRRHVLAALSNLGKFLGKYENVKLLIKDFCLR